MNVTAKISAELRTIPGLKVWPQAPLAPFTSVGIGGPAELLVAAATPEAVAAALAVLQRDGLAPVILGAGSNVLIADAGLDGVVLKLGRELQYVDTPTGACPNLSAEGRGDGVTLEAGSAVPLPRLSSLAAQWGLSGLEFACGIPGTVGGAVVMNAGAHGTDIASVLSEVQLADAGEVRWIPAAELAFSYRSCSLPPGTVLTAVRLRLVPGDPGEISRQRRRFLSWRAKHQPRGARTFGSAFRNPPGGSAGRLLDLAGLKGAARGGAEVSSVHANFILNVGDATAHDVVGLMTLMREVVWRRFHVLLEPEVQVLGLRLPWERDRV